MRLRLPQLRPCVYAVAVAARNYESENGTPVRLRNYCHRCRCSCRCLLPQLQANCVPRPLTLSLPLLLAHCFEKGGGNVPLAGSNRSISFVWTFL